LKAGVRSQNPGVRSQEARARSKEQGVRSQEAEGRRLEVVQIAIGIRRQNIPDSGYGQMYSPGNIIFSQPLSK